MIRSSRLLPILHLRERAEADAQLAHAERLRTVQTITAVRDTWRDNELRTWGAMGAAGSERIPGWELALLSELQSASRRRVIAASADLYTAEQEAEKTRQALVAANQERRTIERLHERAVEHERVEGIKREQATLDELATLSHSWNGR